MSALPIPASAAPALVPGFARSNRRRWLAPWAALLMAMSGAWGGDAAPVVGTALVPYVRSTYLADPAAWCAQVIPGRITQTAQPGEGVPALVVQSERRVEVAPLGSTELVVQAAPTSPITFKSNGLGAFSNGLGCITVPADAQGLARVPFTATAGTVGMVRIVVACPEASGQGTITVVVRPAAAP